MTYYHLFVRRIVLVLLIYNINTSTAFPQRLNEDSIKKVIAQTKDDSVRIISLKRLASFLINKGEDSAGLLLLKQANQEARKINFHAGICEVLLAEGSFYRLKGDWANALSKYKSAADQSRLIKDSTLSRRSRMMALNNLGGIYNINGDYATALDYYLKSREHWNASSLNVAVGKVYTYKRDSAGSLKSLRLNRNTGFGAWINGGVGLGKKLLLSGLFRTSWYEEELNFLVKDNNTGEETTQTAIAQNTLFTSGLNLRYGGAIYTFFVEFLYEKKGLKTPLEALTDVFKVSGNTEIVKSSVKWDVVHPNTLSFGGDWRISQSVVINYGMRCVFDNNWKFRTFTPVATISCMMR